MLTFSPLVSRWIPLVFVTTTLCGLVYIVVQQDLRQSANDPQMQLAEDGAHALTSGASVSAVLRLQRIDLARSLSPFLLITDESGKTLFSSGTLGGSLPTIPVGVFAFAKAHGENRVTWQPRPDVRQAIVVVPFNGNQKGFLVAGRSLAEVERRAAALLQYIEAVWFFMVLGSLFLLWLLPLKSPARH